MATVQFLGGLLLRAALALLITIPGAAADDTPASAAGAPLFASDEPLRMRMTLPLTSLGRDRDDDPEYRPAEVVWWEADGTEHQVALEVRPRGHSRRDREVCTVPPLRLNFPRRELVGTVLEGQDKLKLVTHCRRSTRHERFVIKEYLTYRMLNLLSDVSFRVRALDMEYVDADRKGRSDRRFAFFIEHKDGLASRTGLTVDEREGLRPTELVPEHASVIELFQFLIGNTDYSLIAAEPGDRCCHNAVLLRDAESRFYSVPYDFDITGFVDPPYAVTDYQLPIKDVRQRLYRGFCHPGDVQRDAVALFQARRDDLAALVRGQPGLDERSRRQAEKYLASFYAILDDPARLQRYVLDACRG